MQQCWKEEYCWFKYCYKISFPTPGLYFGNPFKMWLLLRDRKCREYRAANCGLMLWYTVVTIIEITMNRSRWRYKTKTYTWESIVKMKTILTKFFAHLHIPPKKWLYSRQSGFIKCCNKILYCGESQITVNVIFKKILRVYDSEYSDICNCDQVFLFMAVIWHHPGFLLAYSHQYLAN